MSIWSTGISDLGMTSYEAVLADSSLTGLAAIDAIGYIARREHAGSAL